MVGAESVHHSQSHELASCEIRCTTRIIQIFNLLIQFSSTHHLAIETYPSWYIKWSSTKTYKIKKLFNEFFFFRKTTHQYKFTAQPHALFLIPSLHATFIGIIWKYRFPWCVLNPSIRPCKQKSILLISKTLISQSKAFTWNFDQKPH